MDSTFVSANSKLDVVKNLLSDSWIKESGSEFYKNRNSYTIKLNGENHPIWEVNVKANNKTFDENDWKLRQDYKSIKNLGKKVNKKLYINKNNREELIQLVKILLLNKLSLIYNDDYIIFLNGDTLNIFKIAARMNLNFKEDGWYVGNKKIF